MPTRILIVYRYPLLFQALKALMEGEGFRVMGHEDSPEAVRFAQQFQPDIVIVDFELPGGGLESVRQILEELNGEIIRSSIPDESGRNLYTTRKHYRQIQGLGTRILNALSDKVA